MLFPLCAALVDLFSKKESRTKCYCYFPGFRGSGFFGIIITEVAHGLGLFEM